jgi:hypothetical protein
MKTLYIIGNGFDLHHDLQTNYCSFHKYIIKNHQDLSDAFDEFFQLRTDKYYYWTNFEEDLGTFDWQIFYDENCHLDIFNENFKPSETYSCEDDLDEVGNRLESEMRGAFVSWLESIDLVSTKQIFPFEPDSFYITFNYTFLLENTYHIQQEKILHIHGDIEMDLEDIKLGHNQTMEEESERDKNGDSNRTILSDSKSAAKYIFESFHKPVEHIIATNKNLFKNFSAVEKIVVLGHSLNQIDIPYFEEIHKNTTKNAKWTVSYYGRNKIEEEQEREQHLLSLMGVGVEKANIRLSKLEDIKSLN